MSINRTQTIQQTNQQETPPRVMAISDLIERLAWFDGPPEEPLETVTPMTVN